MIEQRLERVTINKVVVDAVDLVASGLSCRRRNRENGWRAGQNRFDDARLSNAGWSGYDNEPAARRSVQGVPCVG